MQPQREVALNFRYLKEATRIFTETTRIFTEATRIFTEATRIFTEATRIFTETTKILLICLFAQLMKTDCETHTVSICVMLL